MQCTYDSNPPTRYYDTHGGERRYLCADCASRFGYPQYLVEVNPPKPPLRQAGYIAQVFDGTGTHDPLSERWPFEEDVALSWAAFVTGCDKTSAEWLIADAIWAAYQPQYLNAGELSVEVTKVTCLLLV